MARTYVHTHSFVRILVLFLATPLSSRFCSEMIIPCPGEKYTSHVIIIVEELDLGKVRSSRGLNSFHFRPGVVGRIIHRLMK